MSRLNSIRMTLQCRQIRKDILEIARHSGHGHVPTCFSIVEILMAVYATMRHDPKNPQWDKRDLFVLSKGHGALAHYCVLAELGYFDIQKVRSFGHFESDFGCHADRHKIPGVEVSTGSLGHGIGIAVGMALAFKIKKSDRRVSVVIGDGESNEGAVWEAVMIAVNLKLGNLTILYDNNHSHSRGLQIEKPAAHFKGFGCEVDETDGHDLESLKEVLKKSQRQVRVVVANTPKGYGCPTLTENHYAWHRRSPTEEEYQQLIIELQNTR